MYYTVDRIENEIAVLFSDDGERLEIPIKDLPPVSESDILFCDGNVFRISEEEKRRRVEEMKNKLKRLNIKNKRH